MSTQKFRSVTTLLTVLLLMAFHGDIFGQQYQCFSPDADPPPPPDCGNLSHYIPDETDPVKTVRIALHVMQREAPAAKDNFDENNPAHVTYLNDVINRLNSLFSDCNVQWCNGSYIPVGQEPDDSRIRFELTGIYYHRDDAGYNNEDGTYYNNYCYDNYGVCKDEILNIFLCQIADVTSGYGPSTHVMLFNLYDDYQQYGPNWWGHGNLLGHEVGHVFGLSHSWVSYQQFPDMCQNAQQSGSWCHPGPSAPNCTNNMMSYSALNDFISPLQMARMHYTLMTGSVSKYLKTEPNSAQNITITTPTVWDHVRVVYGDVTIEPEASLYIQCKTIMAPGRRIIVKNGARLIVDNARITTKGPAKTTCNGTTNFEKWGGIEVWGNSQTTTADMYDEDYPLKEESPGVVILKNGALIEHAQVGVFAQSRGGTWEEQLLRFGGLVYVNNAEFRNCRKAVEFISPFPLETASTFTTAKFKQTVLGTSLANPTKTYEGVTSWQVSGMLFNENSLFENLERGLVLGNSTASVLKSAFTLNKFAVELGMTSPTANAKTFIGGTNGNTFKYCDWGVYGKSYGFLIVRNNLFEDCYNGVVLNGTSIYKIEENEFKNTTTNGNPAFAAGIGLIQSGNAAANSIYCNEYNTVGANGPLLKDGIFVGGDNSGTYFESNKFDCWWDVRLSQLDNPNDPANPFKGSLPDQGGVEGNPVYNEFTSYSIWEHKAEIFTPAPNLNYTQSFKYYAPGNTCPSQVIPRRAKTGVCSDGSFNFVAIGNSSSPTPPSCSFGPIDGFLKPQDCRVASCLTNYNARITQKDNLLLPGNAPSLYTAVQSAPNQLSTLNALNQASPYLSEDLLTAVLNSSMTSTNKRNVLASNLPLSPFVSTLAGLSLTEGDYSYLIGLQAPDYSLRDQAIQDRKWYVGKKMALLRHLTDSLYSIGNISAAAQLLANDPERFSREALFGLRIQTKDYAAAAQLLASYPTADPEDARFKLIQTINLERINANGSYAVSSEDKAALLEIAESYSAQAGYAQVLLNVLTGDIFEPNIPEVVEERSNAILGKPANQTAAKKDAFLVYPNPATDVLTVNIGESAAASDRRLIIRDIYGKVVGEHQFPAHILDISISNLRAGIYTVTLTTENGALPAQYFVKIKQ